jgi:hypothetical protein
VGFCIDFAQRSKAQAAIFQPGTVLNGGNKCNKTQCTAAKKVLSTWKAQWPALLFTAFSHTSVYSRAKVPNDLLTWSAVQPQNSRRRGPDRNCASAANQGEIVFGDERTLWLYGCSRERVINYDLFMSSVEKMRLHNLESLGGERERCIVCAGISLTWAGDLWLIFSVS